MNPELSEPQNLNDGEALLHALIEELSKSFTSIQMIAQLPSGEICVARKGKKIKLGIPEKFWSRVDRSGGEDSCWEFSGWRNKSGGHGLVNIGGGQFQGSHRLAWILMNGKIPDGLCVCHRCDNPPCCNPKHLFLATALENFDDMRRKGRARGGSLPGKKNKNSKLTEEQVSQIRMRYANGELQQQLANAYGVNQTAISYIVSQGGWRHVK